MFDYNTDDDSDNAVGITRLDFWRIKTISGQIFCNLDNIFQFVDNPDYYRELIYERTNLDTTRTILNFYNHVPNIPDITEDTIFINSDGIGLLFMEQENYSNKEWLYENVYEFKEQRNNENHMLIQLFKEFNELFTKKTRGHNLSFFTKSFMELWTRLVVFGDKEPWVRAMTNNIVLLSDKDSYLIFNGFNDRFIQYNIQFLITRILMFFNGKVTFDPEENHKSNKMFSIVKHKNQDNTPFHQMSLSSLTKPYRKKPKVEDSEIFLKQLEACKLMHSNNFPKVDYDNLIKLGDPLSLNESNAGPNFKAFESAVQSHSQFLLEIANRELSGFSSTYANITSDFENTY